jgi:hypothetical protein
MKVRASRILTIIYVIITFFHLLVNIADCQSVNKKIIQGRVFQKNKFNLYEGMTHELSFEINFRDKSALNGFIRITPQESKLIKLSLLASTCSFIETTVFNLENRPVCYVTNNGLNIITSEVNGYDSSFGMSNNFMNSFSDSIYFKITNISVVKLNVLVYVDRCGSNDVVKISPNFVIGIFSSNSFSQDSLISQIHSITNSELECYKTAPNEENSYLINENKTPIPIFMEHFNFILDSSAPEVNLENVAVFKRTTNSVEGNIFSKPENPEFLAAKNFDIKIRINRANNFNYGFSFAGPWTNPKQIDASPNIKYNYIESKPMFMFPKDFYQIKTETKNCVFNWSNKVLTEYKDPVDNTTKNNQNDIIQIDLYNSESYPQFSNYLINSNTARESQKLVFSQDDTISLTSKKVNEIKFTFNTNADDRTNPGGYGKDYTFMLDLINQFTLVFEEITSITSLIQVTRELVQSNNTGNIAFNSNCVSYKSKFETNTNLFLNYEFYANFYDNKDNLIRVNRLFKLYPEGGLFNKEVSETKDNAVNFYFHTVDKTSIASNISVCMMEIDSAVWSYSHQFNSILLFLQNITLFEIEENQYPIGPLNLKTTIKAFGYNGRNTNFNYSTQVENSIIINDVTISPSTYHRYLGSYIMISNISQNSLTQNKKDILFQTQSNPVQNNLFIPTYCPILTDSNISVIIKGITVNEPIGKNSEFSLSYRIVNTNLDKNYIFQFSYTQLKDKLDLSVLNTDNKLNLYYTDINVSISSLKTGIIFMTKEYNFDESDYLKSNYKEFSIWFNSNNFFYGKSKSFSVFGHSFNKYFIIKPLENSIPISAINKQFLIDNSFNETPTFSFNNFNFPNVLKTLKNNNNTVGVCLLSDLMDPMTNLVYNISHTDANLFNNLNYNQKDILYFSGYKLKETVVIDEIINIDEENEVTDSFPFIESSISNLVLVEIKEILPRIINYESIWTLSFIENESININKINEISLYFKKEYLQSQNIYCGIEDQHNVSCYIDEKSNYLILNIQLDSRKHHSKLSDVKIINAINPNINLLTTSNFLVTFNEFDNDNLISNLNSINSRIVRYTCRGIFKASTIVFSSSRYNNEKYSIYKHESLSNLSGNLFFTEGSKHNYYIDFYDLESQSGTDEVLEEFPIYYEESMSLNNLISNTRLLEKSNLQIKFFIYEIQYKVDAMNNESIGGLKYENLINSKHIHKQNINNANFECPCFVIIQFSEIFDFLLQSPNDLKMIQIYLMEYSWKYQNGKIIYFNYIPQNENEEVVINLSILDFTSRSIILETDNLNTHDNFAYFSLSIINLPNPKIKGNGGIENVFIYSKNYNIVAKSLIRKKEDIVNYELDKKSQNSHFKESSIIDKKNYYISLSNEYIIKQNIDMVNNFFYKSIEFSNDLTTKNELLFIFRKPNLDTSLYSKNSNSNNALNLNEDLNRVESLNLDNKQYELIDKTLFTVNEVYINPGRFTRGVLSVINKGSTHAYTKVYLLTNENSKESDTFYSTILDKTLVLVGNGKPKYDHLNINSNKDKMTETWLGVKCGTLPGKYISYFNVENTHFFYKIPPVIVYVNNSRKGTVRFTVGGNSKTSNFGTSISGHVLLYINLDQPNVDEFNIKLNQIHLDNISKKQNKVSVKQIKVYRNYSTDESSDYSSIISTSFSVNDGITGNIFDFNDEYKFELSSNNKCYKFDSKFIFITRTNQDSQLISLYEIENNIGIYNYASNSETINNENIKLNEFKIKFNINPKISMQKHTFIFCKLLCSNFEEEEKIVEDSQVNSLPNTKIQELQEFNNFDTFEESITGRQYIQKKALNIYDENLIYEMNFKNLFRNEDYVLKCNFSDKSFDIMQRKTSITLNKYSINSIELKPLLKTYCFEFILKSKDLNDFFDANNFSIQELIRMKIQEKFSIYGFKNDGCIIILDSNGNTEYGFDLPEYKSCSNFYNYYKNKEYNEIIPDKEPYNLNSIKQDSNSFISYTLCTVQIPDCPTNVNNHNRSFMDIVSEISFWNKNEILSEKIEVSNFNGLDSLHITSDILTPNIDELEFTGFNWKLYNMEFKVKVFSNQICHYYVPVNTDLTVTKDDIIFCKNNPFFCGDFAVSKFQRDIQSHMLKKPMPEGNYELYFICKNNFPFTQKYSKVKLIQKFKQLNLNPNSNQINNKTDIFIDVSIGKSSFINFSINVILVVIALLLIFS